MIKFFQSFGGVFVLKVVSEFGFGNGKCHFSSVEQIFPFCGWCWIDMLGKLPLFSLFVKHWRNDVIPQKMMRPTPHWHPLLVFYRPAKLGMSLPELFFTICNFKYQCLCLIKKCTKKWLLLTHFGQFSSLFCRFLAANFIRCQFRLWEVRSENLQPMQKHFPLEIPIVAFLLSRLFLCS